MDAGVLGRPRKRRHDCRVLDLASLGMRLVGLVLVRRPPPAGPPATLSLELPDDVLGQPDGGPADPHPVHVAPDDPLPIVRWMTSVLRAGGTPHLLTYATSAVRLSQAALAAGIDLRGARIWVGGEPLTPARAASIRQSGAEPWTRYATMESGVIAAGCLAPEASDDVHVYEDLHAVIQPDAVEPGGPFPPEALLVTAIRPTAPLLLINASTGDRAIRTRRQCGCALERCGWTTHLRTVRSFEKLTAGGMTFLDAHVVQVLERRCRRGSVAVRQATSSWRTRRPRGIPACDSWSTPGFPPVDPEGVARVFLESLGAGSAPERMMEKVWQDSAFVTVERSVPRVTVAGKIQHVHVERAPSTHRAGRTQEHG